MLDRVLRRVFLIVHVEGEGNRCHEIYCDTFSVNISAEVEEVIEELSSETGEAVSPLPEIIASKKRALDDQKDTHLKDNIPIANDPSQVGLEKLALRTTKKLNKLSLRRNVTKNQGAATQHEPTITQGRGTDWRPHPTPPKRKITISGPGPNFYKICCYTWYFTWYFR